MNPRKKAIFGCVNSSEWHREYFIIYMPDLNIPRLPKWSRRVVKKRVSYNAVSLYNLKF